MQAGLKDFDIGPIHIDEGYKPWLFNGMAPTPAPASSGPWKCSACGMENITGRFCPQCGSPRQ
ncbi:MAG: hypothetical protein MJ059_08070 [Lachnospiraceae bacterium]|nr:hypothetical protein [Lachnospiraceae bacterium]